MTANPPPLPDPTPEPEYDAAADGWCMYPGFGSRADVLARIRLLDWISTQIGQNGIEPEVGDYVLATEGRILGYGPDLDELHRRIDAAEPELRKTARIVMRQIPPREW